MTIRYYVEVDGRVPVFLFRSVGPRVDVWAASKKWVASTTTRMELDGLGGDIYLKLDAGDVDRVKTDLA